MQLSLLNYVYPLMVENRDRVFNFQVTLDEKERIAGPRRIVQSTGKDGKSPFKSSENEIAQRSELRHALVVVLESFVVGESSPLLTGLSPAEKQSSLPAVGTYVTLWCHHPRLCQMSFR